jgi:glycosyltransferase involved in cell wall biosynthesis
MATGTQKTGHFPGNGGVASGRVLLGPANGTDNRHQYLMMSRLKGLLSRRWEVALFGGNHHRRAKRPAIPNGNGLLDKLATQAAVTRDMRRSLAASDILHLFCPSDVSFAVHVAPAILLGRFYGKKIILSYRHHEAEIELEKNRLWMPLFLRMCDLVVVSTQYIQRVFAWYGIDSAVIPEAVAADMFRPRKVEKIQPRIILTRAHVSRNNLTCALKAYRLVKQKYPRAEMVIAGDGPQRADLEALVAAEKLNGITFIGEVEQRELARWFAEVDVYVNCSTIDGLPASLLEALAAGLPVVTTGVGGIPEVVKDGVNGLIVPPNDPATLAERVFRLVESPELAAKLSEQAQQSVRRYSWEQVCRQWEDVFFRLFTRQDVKPLVAGSVQNT